MSHDFGTTTYSFLFTDIEGSTRRWESHRAAMAIALALHDAILRSAVDAKGGRIFKTVGDAVCAVFDNPGDALGSALDAQRALAAEDWTAQGLPPPGLKVRMALHTGLAEARDDDYFGPALNRLSRLLATAHGGQILVSEAAGAIAQDHLPAGTALRPLGAIRLKDLERPERALQLDAPGLASEFPPPRVTGPRPNNLPTPPNQFVGRVEALGHLRTMLTRSRLVTLTGPGGTGKTRLALETATALLPEMPDGAWWIDLSPLDDGNLALPTLATAMGIKGDAGRPLSETLRQVLAQRQALLVLDNCEHIIDAASDMAAQLLAFGPELRILATSRERLALPGEALLPIAPMALPERTDPGTSPDPVALGGSEAVQLLLDRARAVAPSFALTAENAAAVASLCTRLDGLPLAIELVAARLRMMSPAEALSRLDQRFLLLAGADRGRPARQQTLRGAIDWSYGLLDPGEQMLFRRLAVFRGGWRLEAAEAVVVDAELADLEVMDRLAQLVDKSLVQVEPDGTTSRYRFLESLRAYARERLEASGEGPATRDRLLGWTAALAATAAPGLEGPAQRGWLDRLDEERDNLRASLDWCAEGGNVALGLRMAGDLHHWWYQRGDLVEARDRLLELLELGTSADPGSRARARRTLAVMRIYLGEVSAAGDDFSRAAELALEAGDVSEQMRALAQHAWQALHSGERARIGEHVSAAERVLCPDTGDWDRALLAMCRSFLSQVDGNWDAALAASREVLDRYRSTGDGFYTAVAWNNLGWARVLLGESTRAVSDIESGLALAKEQAHPTAVLMCLTSLGRAWREAGRPESARQALAEALAMIRRRGMTLNLAECLQHLAALEIEANRVASASRLLGAVESVLANLGQQLDNADPEAQRTLEVTARARLDPETFRMTYLEGRNLSIEQALQLGLALTEG